MRLTTRLQAQQIDTETFRQAQSDPQILNSNQMMLLASEKCVDAFIKYARPNQLNHIIVLCGPGRNGKDGQIIGQILKEKNYRCQIMDWQNLKNEDLQKLSNADFLIDAIFGIGLNRQLNSQDILKLKIISDLKIPIFAIDSPTGLNLDTGHDWGFCLTAKWTCAIGRQKPGYFLNFGPEKCGYIIPLSLPYPETLIKQIATTHFLMTKKLAQKFKPPRPAQSSKANYGNAILIASSQKFIGAGVLSAVAASRIGAGFVTLSSFDQFENFKIDYPEFLYREIDSTLKDLKNTNQQKAIAIGPGLGKNIQVDQAVKALLKTPFPVVVDADALIAIKKITALKSNWILTPHRLELARILDIDVSAIDRDPCYYSLFAAKKWNCLVLLKGFHTVIANQEFCVIIPTGNSALAKAGSGDVLTGMITGLLAQGLSTFKAACLAAYLHGSFADQWVFNGNATYSMMPIDLLDFLKKSW